MPLDHPFKGGDGLAKQTPPTKQSPKPRTSQQQHEIIVIDDDSSSGASEIGLPGCETNDRQQTTDDSFDERGWSPTALLLERIVGSSSVKQEDESAIDTHDSREDGENEYEVDSFCEADGAPLVTYPDSDDSDIDCVI